MRILRWTAVDGNTLETAQCAAGKGGERVRQCACAGGRGSPGTASLLAS